MLIITIIVIPRQRTLRQHLLVRTNCQTPSTSLIWITEPSRDRKNVPFSHTSPSDLRVSKIKAQGVFWLYLVPSRTRDNLLDCLCLTKYPGKERSQCFQDSASSSSAKRITASWGRRNTNGWTEELGNWTSTLAVCRMWEHPTKNPRLVHRH